jgi:hypothetical protein
LIEHSQERNKEEKRTKDKAVCEGPFAREVQMTFLSFFHVASKSWQYVFGDGKKPVTTLMMVVTSLSL